MSSFFDLILLAMAVYVLVSGITGKGRLYEIENLKEGMEEKFLSVSRKLFLGLGTAMLLNSGSSLLLIQLYTYDENYQLTVPEFDLGPWAFLTPKLLQTLTYVGLGLLIVLLIVFGVFVSKVTDRNAPSKKKEDGGRSRGGRRESVKLPSHAFEFDAEDDAVQQVPAETKKK